MSKRFLSLALAVLMCAAIFAGCTSGSTTLSTTSAASATTAAATSGSAATTNGNDDGFTGYPMTKTDKTLSFYILINYAYAVPDGVDRNDNYFNQKLAEKVGVKIDWQAVPAGTDAGQAFNLMLASSELPDIYYNAGVPNTAADLLESGTIADLSDYLPKYAPAYYAKLKSDESIDKSVKTDDGKYYGFAFLRENLYLGTYAGPVVRQDLLDKVGMTAPVTISDWDKMLRAFKDQNLAKYPFSVSGGTSSLSLVFQGAYGSTANFYVDDNQKIQFGYATDGYKEFLKQMNQWYKDGIIDPDMLTNDAAALETKVLNSEVGACQSTGGTVIGFDTKLKANNNTTDTWAGVSYPVLNSGDKVQFTQGETNNIGLCAVITSSCKDIPLACRFLDYGYTEEGMALCSFGEEGVTFEYDSNGVPKYLDSFINDPRGNDFMMKTYTGMSGNCATVHMLATTNTYPELRKKAVDSWYVEGTSKHLLPGSLTMTTDESQSIANEKTAIDTYATEMFAKFVLGQESLDGFDAYLAQLKGMGLEKVQKVYQDVYDRYLSR
ncbi:MAG: hypothetical protein VB070_03825 [Clostridiaceae bacterium]|nr:hypothetical protein [Clostridiaceae bacterium]